MNMKIYIAGAHSRASTMGYYLQYLDPTIEILAYLYDNAEKNPKCINGVPVIYITEKSELDTECQVYLAMRGVNHPHMKETLMRCGMKKIIPVDVELDLSIRNCYLKKYYNSIGREYIKIGDLNFLNTASDNRELKARIYVAGSAFDKPLQNPYTLAEYEKLIQVGADLTSIRLDSDCLDNIGENISARNSQFCELTGLYWIWKHASEDVVGLVHYRRHFTLPVDWVSRMNNHNIDVILPIPLYVAPSIEGNFRSRHTESVWDTMLAILKQQNDKEEASNFFKETALYSPCNMFIMRREILDELCKWMFPIIFEVAERCGSLDDSYQNRYPGFISERLITYFFEKNRSKYKVVYSDKNFLA